MKTVLNVVRHQGELFRLGVVGGEYKREDASKIILKGFAGLEGKAAEFFPHNSYYKYGSIYSRALSDWLIANGYRRGADDDIWLIKAEFITGTNKEHIFEYREKSPYVKISRRYCLKKKNGELVPYKKGELVQKVWEEDGDLS